MATRIAALAHVALLLVPAVLSPGCLAIVVKKDAQEQATEHRNGRAPPQGSSGECASQRAASFLAERGQRLGSSGMEALALRVRRSSPESLDDVKVLLRKMLEKAKAAHADDVGLHQFCSSESQASKERVVSLEDRCEKAHADLDKLSVRSDQAKQKIADLHTEVATSEKALSSAAAKRAAEKAAYEAGRAKEMQVESAQRATARQAMDAEDTAARSAAEARADAAIDRRIKLETGEDAAARDFERRQQEGRQRIEVKGAGAKLEAQSHVKMQADLVEQRRDVEGMEEELSASKDYAQQIAKKCSVPTVTHAERKGRREEELSSLRDAYDILSG